MKKSLCLTMLFCALSFTFAAAQGKIVFESNAHDFGKNIPEKGGNVTHRFVFTNKGNKPVIIHDVTTSCGCTTPDWTKEPVSPGEQGFVDATYRPLGRPGNFTKSLTISNNGTPERVSLTIRGTVIKAPQKPEEEFPNIIGDLRLGNNVFGFGRVTHDGKRTSSLNVYNNSDRPIELSFGNMPEYVELSANPTKVEPKTKATINCNYDFSKIDGYGTKSDQIKLLQNGKEVGSSYIITTSTLIPKINSKDATKDPILQYTGSTIFVFGNIKRGGVVSYDFKLKNTGFGDLELLAINPSTEYLKITANKKVLKPGEEATIKAMLSTKKLPAGNLNTTIEVISNYPAKPVTELSIRGNIVE